MNELNLKKKFQAALKSPLPIYKLHKVFEGLTDFAKVIGESHELPKVVGQFYKLHEVVGKFYEIPKVVHKFY